MKRLGMALAVGVAILGGVSTAGADWREDWNSFWAGVELDYLRNCHWPEPFVYPDRDAVRAPFATMVAKGWQRQNTLGDYHFDPNTHQLNGAGQMRLRAIATQTPADRRTVYVYRGAHPEATAIRVDSVQRHMVGVLPQGELPAVVDTATPPVERPGEQIDRIQTGVTSNMPAPVLPPFQAAGSTQ